MVEATYKTVRTPLLEVAYLETGSADGKPLVLLHGWPDSPRTWRDVADPLAERGWRVLMPAQRGYAATRFLSASTLRSGQTTALAQDVIDFADALSLDRFTLVGHDWGGLSGYLIAAFWPERVERYIAMSVPYRSSSQALHLDPPQQAAYWYQWLFQTDQGRTVLEHSSLALCRELWHRWMAPSKFDQAVFEQIAQDWNNPDWIPVTLSSYRFRYQQTAGDPYYDALEARRLSQPKITVPTLLLHGELDGATLAKTTEGEEMYFAAGYERLLLANVGHFIQREKPKAVLDAVGSPSKTV